MVRKAAALLALAWIASVSPGASRADFLYGGEAYGAFAPGVVAPPLADTGPLPSAGGALTAHLDSFSFMSLVTSGALDARTMGLNGLASSDASVARFHADLRPLGINFFADADLIEAHVQALGTALPFSVAGSALFTNLVVNNTMINSQVAPNTTIDLGAVGSIVLNEETSLVTDTGAEIMLNAMHVHLNGVTDIFLAHAESVISTLQAPVPEPGSLVLLSAGLVGLLGRKLVRAIVRAGGPWRAGGFTPGSGSWLPTCSRCR